MTQPKQASSNIARFLPEQARRQPDTPAVRAPLGRSGDRIRYLERSFARLDAESDACVALLAGHGIARGTRVLLMVRPGMDLIRLCFALFKAGAVPVVIDPGMGLRAFRTCVARTRPDALVGIPLAHGLAAVFRRDFASVRSRVVVRPGRFSRRLDAHAGAAPAVCVAAGADETAAILFTSGSTGAPKGVVYTHGMFAAQLRIIRDTYGIEPGEVDLPMLPVFALFNPALGMTTVVPEMNPGRPATVEPARIVRAIRQNAVTNSFGSPVLWARIGRYCLDRGITLPTLRRVLVAGAPVPPKVLRLLAEVLPNGEVHTPYGATEALPVTTLQGTEILDTTWELTERGTGTCIGRPVDGAELAVIPAQEGPIPGWSAVTPLADDRIGELVVRGPAVTRTYDRLPAATERAKIPAADGSGAVWHRLGDLGYRDKAGRFWFCGRQVERVRLADGTALHTDCCEAPFNRHPKVFRTALLGLGPPDDPVPVLAVEPGHGHWPRGRAARETFARSVLALGEGLPPADRIRSVVFERRFPVDVRHNAKIHRLTLARKWASFADAARGGALFPA